MAQNYHRPRKSRVAIVGLGAVGTALAQAISATGEVDLVLAGKTPPPVRRLLTRLGAKIVPTLTSSLQAPDYLVLAVPERQIPALAKTLRQLPWNWPKISVLHTAGPVGAGVLAPLADLGAGIAAWHPYQTFPRRGRAATLAGITFGISGNRKGMAAGRTLARLLGGRPMVIRDEDRLIYHASAVLACGFVAANLRIAAALLQQTGLSATQARDSVLAIAEETLRNVRDLGLENAQTGPAARGDAATVQSHVRALQKSAPDAASVYRILSAFVLKAGKKQ